MAIWYSLAIAGVETGMGIIRNSHLWWSRGKFCLDQRFGGHRPWGSFDLYPILEDDHKLSWSSQRSFWWSSQGHRSFYDQDHKIKLFFRIQRQQGLWVIKYIAYLFFVVNKVHLYCGQIILCCEHVPGGVRPITAGARAEPSPLHCIALIVNR